MLLAPQFRKNGTELIHRVSLAGQDVPRRLPDKLCKWRYPLILKHVTRHKNRVDLVRLSLAVDLFDAVSRDGFDSLKELRLLGNIDRGYEIM